MYKRTKPDPVLQTSPACIALKASLGEMEGKEKSGGGGWGWKGAGGGGCPCLPLLRSPGRERQRARGEA